MDAFVHGGCGSQSSFDLDISLTARRPLRELLHSTKLKPERSLNVMKT